jgi:hypothetical protein
MRFFAAICMVLTIAVSGPALAQVLEFADREYRFSINFPSPPTAHSITYTIADGRSVPATLFYAENRRGRFSVIAFRLPEDAGHRTDQVAYISQRMRERPGEILYEEVNENDGFPLQLFTIEAPDGRRSMIGILVHERRVYITEGNVAPGAPPPIQFQQTLFMLDEDGEKLGIDYEEYERLNPR